MAVTALPSEELDTGLLSKEAGLTTTGLSRRMNSTQILEPYAATKRCAIYARYSSLQSRESSIEDQVRQCKAAAENRGWKVLDQYIRSDEGKSGTTVHLRFGLQELVLLAKAKPREIDYIICDSSDRFGRNVANVTTLLAILKHHGVNLLFASDGLDSADPHFAQVFGFKAQMDEAYSKGLSDKVRRGQTGRFLNGFNPGGVCYGYRNTPVEDPTRKGEYGRPSVIGCVQSVYEPEAEVVRRMFSDYVAGASLASIAKQLNAEGVVAPGKARARKDASWCKDTVNIMLCNERYIGRTWWNLTYQVRDPETGRMETRKRPEADWAYFEKPELRIVSDELFAAVKAQRLLATRGNINRLGGECRTEASRKYIFSGLLKCGAKDCGVNMTITGTAPARYGCPSHRFRGICANAVTIRLDALESALIGALAAKFSDPALLERIVDGMTEQIEMVHAESVARTLSQESRRVQNEEERTKLKRTIANLGAAIGDLGGSLSLLSSLRAAESRLAQLDEELSTATNSATVRFTRKDIEDFVKERTDRFSQILLGDRKTAKNEMRKLVSEIVLTPSGDIRGPYYVVSGDVGLFSVEDDLVLQSYRQVSFRPQYKVPFSFDILPYKTKRQPVQFQTAA